MPSLSAPSRGNVPLPDAVSVRAPSLSALIVVLTLMGLDASRGGGCTGVPAVGVAGDDLFDRFLRADF